MNVWLIASLTLTAIVLTIAAVDAGAAASPDLKSHVPAFTWRTQPDGERWIYDGEMPVGALYEGPYPICLHDLRLVPGGPIFIERGQFMSPFGIAWRMGGQLNMKIDEITADQKDPTRLKLYFKVHDEGLIDYRDPEHETWKSAIIEETWLELTYDRERGSYIFDVRSRLQVRPGREQAVAERFREFEYQDLLPGGCFDRFPPHGKKRFQWFVYTGPDGRLYKMPHTHHLGPAGSVRGFGEDGILAFVLDPVYNPVVRLRGDTGPRTRGSVCPWAWDFHFVLMDIQAGGKPLSAAPFEVRYQVYSVPESEAKRLLDGAEMAPAMSDPRVRCPAYVIGAPNRFEPSEEYCQPCDRWFWDASDGNCSWDWSDGYKSAGCLTIRRKSEGGRSQWVFNNLGHAYAPHPRLKGRYRVTAMVRTEGIRGRVRLGWQFRVPVKGLSGRYDFRAMEYSDADLSGTNDWTQMALETSETGPAIWAGVYLIQEGAGRSWFDDVEVKPLQ